jgi:polysaccharide chain length determinant protein (PEP-CTERM system associated)
MSEIKEASSFAGLEYYAIRDYWRMLLRRKWFILVGTFAIAFATAAVVYFLPNEYKATTVILIEPQKVPNSYVNSTVTESSAERLAGLREQILSATRLNQVIDEMGLYKQLKNKMGPEQVVQKMQKDISVEPASVSTHHGEKVVGAFSVSYTNSNPVVAAQVTNRLASLFIEDNIKDREQSVLGTADFLTKEVEDAQRDLKAKEDQITELKTKGAGELPESQVIHVQALNTLQTDLQSERDAIDRDQQQKSSLQASLASSPSVVNLDAQESPAVTSLETEKAQLQDEVDQLRKRYGPSFPDIVKRRSQIKDLDTRIDEAKKKETVKGQPAPLKERNPVIQSQIAKVDEDIQKRQEHQQELENQIAFHQQKLQQIPLFEQRMSSVTRDYQGAEDHYKLLLERKFSADMAQDLEVRQKGERFEVLDPAQVPYKPDSPDRPMINWIGLGAGFVISLIVGFALEILNPSVKTEREVVGQLGMPVFGEVPWLPTKANNRQKRLRALYAFVGTAILAAGFAVIMVVTSR